MSDPEQVSVFLQKFQQKVCKSLNSIDKTEFLVDKWQHEIAGGGTTCVLTNGAIIEKAAVNFSHVFGNNLPAAASKLRNLQGHGFEAMGVSIIIHPKNPFVPTTHCNVRFIKTNHPKEPDKWWFGGGFDLTPYYGFRADCIHWHKMAKNACQDNYKTFKKNCDDYFYIPHREEARGIGGIFFDDYNSGGFIDSFALMQGVAEHFLLAYMPIIERRKAHSYNQKQREFQLFRRGRYVEFNLTYDRGTLFGLQSKGRIESILLSLPSPVEWHYNYPVLENSPEQKLYTEFLPAQDWLNYEY